MAAGIGLREVRQCSDDAFERFWSRPTDYVLFECMDDNGSPQGHAVCKLGTRYAHDPDGAFMRVEYLGVSDPYYEHWVLESGASGLFHHVCRHPLSTCRRKVGSQAVVHVQKMAFIEAQDAEAILKEWKCKLLHHVVPI